MAKLNDMIKEFRLSINQSVEALAMMLQISIEEYESLETDWIPPDELLKQMCSLFEWNYNEIKHLVQNQSPAVPKNSSSKTKGEASQLFSFHSMLKNGREQAQQSIEGIATLLNISPEYYETLEQGQIPPDDLVRQICSLFDWNYYNIRQQLINHSVPHLLVRKPPLSLKEVQLPPQKSPPLFTEESTVDTLAKRLQEARTELGQNPISIALLLNISEDYYLKLEDGLTPEPELLKQIATLFHWNYHELKLLVQNENIHQFQPSITELKTTSPLSSHQLEMIFKEIQQVWQQLQSEQQELLLTQLEVIRDTAKRWHSP